MAWSVEWRKGLGEPRTIAGATVTPESTALIVQTPWSAFVWNRPTALQVQQGDRVHRELILDVTRLVELALLVGVLAFALAWNRRRRVRALGDKP